jgi:hypothetical protein
MSMPEAARVWTRHDVLALPDEGRARVTDGELLRAVAVMAHQCVVGELFPPAHHLREQVVGVAALPPPTST